jgi:DNA-binding beta-propeller fold protein YncE
MTMARSQREGIELVSPMRNNELASRKGNPAMRWIALSSCIAVGLGFAACSGGKSEPPSTNAAGSLQASDAVAALGRPHQVPQPGNPYTLFESLQVRPLAVSRDGELLFATNTPDNRLEIFEVDGPRIRPVGSVGVGLEPVAVAVRGPNEVWVVNHLSDSVSVVDVSEPSRPRVVNTLLVGDEPRDIVFAGPNHDRAFITTAHRGQTSPDDPELFAPGVGRADVWVFDANNLGAAAGGQRLGKVTLFADSPRALAASPDGKTVYAASFLSGNQTTSVTAESVLQVYGGTMPGPAAITLGGTTIPQPPTGEVVKYRAGADGTYHWLDAYGSNFDAYVNITLPDDDVFTIDATATPPVAASGGVFQHVGTTLFNMAVNPKSGKVYVTNTEAHNDVRFEGHTAGFTSVVGNNVDSRISVIDPVSATVTPENLNPHLDHAHGTGDPSISLAFPEGIEVTRDGKQLCVIAQGSSKLAAYDTSAIEAGPVAPSAASQVVLSGGGPTGLALGADQRLAFVLTRFDDAISVVDLKAHKEVQHLAMFSPEPASVTAGRRDLYDATHTSALGDQACASCHIGGDFDGLAWDLGNPGNFPLPITTTYGSEADLQTIPEAAIAALVGAQTAGYEYGYYQPLKGPMTTQSLRGLDNHGAMHWRGDRNGAIQQTGLPFVDGSGNPVVTAQPNGGMFDELAAFKSFNVAFPGLVGNAAQLPDGEMTAFASFTLQVTYPPNPIRSLDNSLTAEQQAGHDFYFNQLPDAGGEAPSDTFHNCNGCHKLDRNGNAGATAHPGFFGTDGRLSFEGEPQIFKVAHLRNAYQKLGMYASSPAPTRTMAPFVPQLNGQPASGGPVAAVRGFGYLHDGSIGTVEEFLSGIVFLRHDTDLPGTGGTLAANPQGIPFFNSTSNPFDSSSGISTVGVQLRRALASFVLSYDSNMFPIVGQQVTVTSADASTAAARVALLEAQASAGACDLVVRGRVGDRERGFVLSGGAFVPDLSRAPSLSPSALLALVGNGAKALTFTAVPPGSGWRIGVDRDGDGYADGDEIAAGSDPANARSTP